MHRDRPPRSVPHATSALRKLGDLLFDVRVAHSITQLVNVQRSALEASELEERVERLEVRFVSDAQARRRGGEEFACALMSIAGSEGIGLCCLIVADFH